MPTRPWDSDFKRVHDSPRYDATQALLLSTVF